MWITKKRSKMGSQNFKNIFTNYVKHIIAVVIVLQLYHECLGQNSSYFNNFTVENGLPSNWISCFQMDDAGFLWVGTQNGLSRFDGNNFKNFFNKSFVTNSLAANWVRVITKDDKGNLWLGTIGGGIQRFNPKTHQFYTDFVFDGSQPTIIKDILCESGKIWISTEKGLLMANAPYKNFTYITDTYYERLTKLNKKQLLLTSKNGLFLLNQETKHIKKLNNDYLSSIAPINNTDFIVVNKQKLLTYNLKKSLIKKTDSVALGMVASNSTLWGSVKVFSSSEGLLVSAKNGIWRFDEHQKKLQPFMLFNNDSNDNTVLAYYESKKGDLWMGTKNGIYTVNSYNKTYQRADNGWQNVATKKVRELQLEGDVLWMASEKGLEVKNIKNESKIILKGNITAFIKTKDNQLFAAGKDINGQALFWHYNINTGKKNSYSLAKSGADGVIWKLLSVRDKVWIAGQYCFGYFNKNKETLQFIPLLGAQKVSSLVITDLLLDNNKLWIATLNGLLISRNSNFNSIEQYKRDEKTGLTNEIIVDLHKDKNGKLWLASDSGLHLFDETNTTFKHWGRADGLLDTKVLTIASDDQNMLWLGTISGGLFKFDPTTENFTNFNQKLGLTSNEFLMSSSFSNGNQMFFGTEQRIVAFDASKLTLPKKDTIQLKLETISIDKGLETNTLDLKDNVNFKLPHNYGNLSFNFNTTNYYNPEATKYAYKITGFYNSWIPLGNSPSFSLVNLPSGKYQLIVKAENPLFESVQQNFDFVVKRPFYSTVWAWLLYIILTTSAFLLYWRYRKNKLIVKNRLENLEEVNRLKSKMYAEISHELKTPLALIKGSTSLLSKKEDKEDRSKALNTIQRSSTEMLSLVNQMLDLAAIDANRFEINTMDCDLILFLKQFIEFFDSQAKSQDKDIFFQNSLDSLSIKIDVQSLKKILFNLISNAIKFTPSGGEIKIKLTIPSQEKLKLTINDTGLGIAPEHLPKIFDRYYRTFDLDNNLGTGIGMALTKELVQLMGGTIEVKSKLNKGTTFTINLPIQYAESINKSEEEAQEFSIAKYHSSPSSIENKEAFQLVVVEDNKSLQDYYRQLLDNKYNVRYFQNGEEALDHLKVNSCDFILSDAIMPKMDGYQLCKALKNDWTTSHIPFIMVSVLSEVEHKERGYQIGIDAFLVKPFEEQELLAVISNLLKKQKLQADYFRKFFSYEKEATSSLTPKDLEFIEKLQILLLDNDKNLTVENLAKELAMSRSQLHRKVKALTEMSTSDYMNHIRIEKAKEMLKDSSFNINEIAYQIGYSDPSYFSKVFKKITKSSPQTWRNTSQKRTSEKE